MTATAQAVPADPPLTYEAYLAEPEMALRYEILEGVRIFMTSPNRQHQLVLIQLAGILEEYRRSSRLGRTLIAPCDVLIRRDPLRTRQPDLLFISHERLARCGPPTDPTPLLVGPELAVEILSPSETRRAVAEKLDDYRSVEVLEVWMVDPKTETVEVVRLTAEGDETIATAGRGGEARLEVFPGLVAPVDRIFDA